MGKTLLRAHLRRRKARCALPCKRFCSCCGENSFKPSHLKSKKSLLKKQEARKRDPGFGKTLKGPKRIQVNTSKNKLKSVCKFNQERSSVRDQLKTAIVNVRRLSKNVLQGLSENGSICVCRVSTEGVCNLSPNSKSLNNSCFISPTRRLRSTTVKPFVRQNVMGRLRELNADWRSTTHPSCVDPVVSPEASDNIQGPGFSMKTLFLENLSICKKTPGDESAKENVKMPQNENRTSLINRDPHQNIQQLKNRSMPKPSPSNVQFTPYPILKPLRPSVSKSPSQPISQSKISPVATRQTILPRTSTVSVPPIPLTVFRSLLGDRIMRSSTNERLAMKSMVRQNFSLLPQPSLILSPEKLSRTATVPDVPRIPLNQPLQPSKTQKSNLKPKILETNQKQDGRNKLQAAHKSSVEKCASKNDPSTSRLNAAAQVEKRVNPLQRRTLRKSIPKPKILGINSKQDARENIQAAHKPTVENCARKNAPSTSKLNFATESKNPRVSRRKQAMAKRPLCCNVSPLEPLETEFKKMVSNHDDKSSAEKSAKRTHATANSYFGKESNKPNVHDMCSSPKKPKIAPKTSVSSKTVSSNFNCTKREKSDVPAPKKIQDGTPFYTIVLSDSSEDERVIDKATPATPIAAKAKTVGGKCTPIRNSARKKYRGEAASKTIPLRDKSNECSKGPKDNVKRDKSDCSKGPKGHVKRSKTPVAVNRVPERRSSLRNRRPSVKAKEAIRLLKASDSESEELSSDSEDDAPRYVSRTGRSVGVSSGCRSCPGCKIDVPRKEKPTPKPRRKKRRPEPKLPSPDEDSAVSESDSYVNIVHAGSKEPPTAVIHGLTSSESSDELADEEFVGMLKEARMALVVVADNGPGESKDSNGPGKSKDSPPGGEVMDDVFKAANVPSTVTSIADIPAKTISRPKDDGEGPDHIDNPPESNCKLPDAGVYVRLSEGSSEAIVPSAGSDTAENHISQTSECKTLETLGNRATTALNPSMLADLSGEPSSPALPVEGDVLSEGCQTPANSELGATQHPTTGMEMVDDEGDGLANPPHSAPEVESTPEVQCYVRQYDSNGTLLLHEINCDFSEDDISYENAESEPQLNEKIGDDVSVPLLVDNSSETSDNSSAIVNFDSNEYTESESTCSSPQGSSQGLSGPPEGKVPDNGSDCCDVDDASHGGNIQLCSPGPLTEGDLQREEALSVASNISHDVPLSSSSVLINNVDGETPLTAHENELAAENLKFQEGLASVHGPMLPPEFFSEIRDEALGVSPLDIPVPQDSQKSQGEVTFKVPSPEKIDPFNQNSLNTREHENIPQDCSRSLDDFASHGNMLLVEVEPSPLKVSPITREVSNLSNPTMVLSQHGVGTGNICETQPSQIGDPGCGEGASQDIVYDEVASENHHASQDNSTYPQGIMTCSTQPTLEESSSTTLSKPTELSNLHPDAQDESACETGIVQNDTSEISSTSQECQMLDGNQNLLEIDMLEGCPSCLGGDKPAESSSPRHASQDSSGKNPSECLDSFADNQGFTEISTPGDFPVCGADYSAISNLLIDCLNSIVKEVKFNNREVIIKKVDPRLAENAPETGPASQEAGPGAEDFASIVQELKLPVKLNPRLTIKKLPFIPREGNAPRDINCASRNSQDIVSSNESAGSLEDYQVPENRCTTSNTTPTKSIYERKGFPTPVERLDPRVLSVIKYNDLEICNDEPSLNDPPKSDRLECVSSKGIRFELNPEELANIENFLNDFQDKSIQRPTPGEAAETSFEIDDLVIYNDEPPLNPIPIKSLKYPRPLFENGEDPEDLVFDNDAPPLNEPVEADLVDKPSLNDPECMVISSDDEVVLKEPLAEASQPEVLSERKVVPDAPSEPISKPRKKLFRKKRSSRNPVVAPSIIDLQRSQEEFRGEDPHEYFGARNQQVSDVNELVFPSDDDIIDEIVIDDGGVETLRQPSWEPLPPFQSCREVLHQPQVFNHQGQPLLKLDAFGHYSGPNPAIHKSSKESTSSSENVSAVSQFTFDLSETFQDTADAECINGCESDTLTASECGDEVVVISPRKASSSTNVNRNTYTNGYDTKGIVQTVDTDSDDDVIMMSGPVDVPPVNARLQNFPSPVVPSPVECIDLCARERNVSVLQPNEQIRENLPAQFTTAQVRAIRTASGNSYYVLVVPPNNPRMTNLHLYPPIPR